MLLKHNKVFLKNIISRIIEIGFQIKHLVDAKSNKAKSGYYRIIIILSSTIIEGVLYALVEDHLSNNGGYIFSKKEFKNKYPIPKQYSDKDLYLCVREDVNIELGKDIKFIELIEYAYKNKLISRREKNRLDFVRKLRNNIHIQSLDVNDRGYTMKKTTKVADAVHFLLRKL